MRLTFPLAVSSSRFARPPPGWGCPCLVLLFVFFYFFLLLFVRPRCLGLSLVSGPGYAGHWRCAVYPPFFCISRRGFCPWPLSLQLAVCLSLFCSVCPPQAPTFFFFVCGFVPLLPLAFSFFFPFFSFAFSVVFCPRPFFSSPPPPPAPPSFCSFCYFSPIVLFLPAVCFCFLGVRGLPCVCFVSCRLALPCCVPCCFLVMVHPVVVVVLPTRPGRCLVCFVACFVPATPLVFDFCLRALVSCPALHPPVVWSVVTCVCWRAAALSRVAVRSVLSLLAVLRCCLLRCFLLSFFFPLCGPCVACCLLLWCASLLSVVCGVVLVFRFLLCCWAASCRAVVLSCVVARCCALCGAPVCGGLGGFRVVVSRAVVCLPVLCCMVLFVAVFLLFAALSPVLARRP